MKSLRIRGGQHQRAYDEACKIIESLRYGEDVSHKMTKHGETRIAHVVKYDISNDAHRLVTVHSDNCIYLIFVGTHEETERWLDRNRGLQISASKEGKKITVTHVTQESPESWRALPQPPPGSYTDANECYFARVPGMHLDEWIKKPFLLRSLAKWNEDTTDDEIEEALALLAESDKDTANLFFDLICELRENKIDAAIARLEESQFKAVAVQQDSALEEDALQSVNNADQLLQLSNLTQEEVRRLFSPDEFEKWMLFLHPEQKRIVEADYDRPVVLTGVSGSGKTCVLVHRARRLARKYPGERIGILTLNRSLARLINNLVEALCTPEERENIHVCAFYDYFKQLVQVFGPAQYLKQLSDLAQGHDHEPHILRAIHQVQPSTFANHFDPKSGETIEDTWDIFVDQPHVATQIAYLSNHLRAYQQSLSAKQYLKEEFSLIRSSFATPSRLKGYPDFDRAGRAIPFPKKQRIRILQLLLVWEEVMLSGGMLDELGLTLALLPERPQLRELPQSSRFRCLLIDEFQDFSTLDLGLLRLIPTDSENGLFVAGDPVQKVHVKSLKMASVGLDILSAVRERITKNYRNSRQILKAASLLANHYGSMARKQDEDIELLDPELAVRETARPFVVQVTTAREQDEAWRIATECLGTGGSVPWSVTIVTASPSAISVADILAAKPTELQLKAERISGDYSRKRDSITVGEISEIKGFEFTVVIIVGCGSETLPNPTACHDEGWREALHFYVAMTRARDNLFLLHSGRPSEFLDVMRSELDFTTNPVIK